MGTRPDSTPRTSTTIQSSHRLPAIVVRSCRSGTEVEFSVYLRSARWLNEYKDPSSNQQIRYASTSLIMYPEKGTRDVLVQREQVIYQEQKKLVPGSPVMAVLALVFVLLYVSSLFDLSRFFPGGSNVGWKSCFQSSPSLDEQYLRKQDLENYLEEHDSFYGKGWDGHIMEDTPKPLEERYFRKADKNVKVDLITMTAHVQKQNLDGKPLLHWRVGAAFGEDPENNVGRSVSYDTGKVEGDTNEPIIQVDITSKPKFAFSSKSAVTIFLQPVEGHDFTPNDVANVIKGVHGPPVFWKYKYDGNGSGCLYWSKQLISKLESLGWIEAGALAKVEAQVTAARGTNKWWIPEDRGQFFDQPAQA